MKLLAVLSRSTLRSSFGGTALFMMLVTVWLAVPDSAAADSYYVRSTVGRPWNQSVNEGLMNDVFGVGGWVDARFELVSPATMFANAEFIFLEGSDDNASELESFLIANGTALAAYVNGGGAIFINSAPNEGNGMSLGFGLSLIYPMFCSSGCTAVDPTHPIFNGPSLPVGTTFSGNAFTHAAISGPATPLLRDSAGNVLLAELAVGRGIALFGGMTTTNFHSPQPGATGDRAFKMDILNVR